MPDDVRTVDATIPVDVELAVALQSNGAKRAFIGQVLSRMLPHTGAEDLATLVKRVSDTGLHCS